MTISHNFASLFPISPIIKPNFLPVPANVCQSSRLADWSLAKALGSGSCRGTSTSACGDPLLPDVPGFHVHSDSVLLASFSRTCPLHLHFHKCQHYRFPASTHAFLAPSRFPAFYLKCPAYFAYFELEKMHSMRSAQCRVELKRLGNQLHVLGKANSLCKIVCVLPVFTPG